MALAEENHRLPSRIVTSPPETCLVTCFKSLTYDALANVIPVPKLYQGWQDVDEFPVFAKPDRGQGSQRARAVFSRSQLASLLEEESDLIVCEYLPGEEYTVDCFSDREAGLLFCGGRTRKRTKSGISMNSLPVNDEAFRQYALSISNKLDLHGAWFFQLKRDREGVLRLLEVAPRIAGTMALHRVLGLNFPLLSIYEQERIPVEIMLNDCVVEVDRALVNRYRHNFRFRSVYVDFDDTLVFNEGVNTEVVRFLFQCINQGKRVVLLTRHEGDLQEVLSRYRLTGIFDEIIKVGPESSKADYIADREAILIDDSFSERKEVFNRTGIFSFDCSMLEILLDERL
ncbi:MAG: ATP-grasp domain-containing protein [Thermodesulfobacteriota bacterium]|nr:ATP-grasp domain-containing protein [Thermodesulfobacteriota bacterium]